MRSQPSLQAESPRDHLLRLRSGLNARSVTARAALWAIPLLLSGALVSAHANGAQTSSAPTNGAQANPAKAKLPSAPPAASTHKSAHPHKKPAAAVPVPPPQPAPPPAPVLPPPPNWPANDLPAAASVVFDSHGLSIVASNSSLAQILKDVATDTGAKVEGMGADERIFGTYGPGPPRDVLRQLLDGSGYNVLMVGDRGAGTPRRVVLTIPPGSAMQATAKTPAPPNSDDADSDQQAPEPEAEHEPPPNSPGPPVPIRTPQQMIEERNRQMQQMQNGQQNPQNQPNPQN